MYIIKRKQLIKIRLKKIFLGNNSAPFGNVKVDCTQFVTQLLPFVCVAHYVDAKNQIITILIIPKHIYQNSRLVDLISKENTQHRFLWLPGI